MKKKNVIKNLANFIGFAIAFALSDIVGDIISAYFGISSDKFFSWNTFLNLIIYLIIMSIVGYIKVETINKLNKNKKIYIY